MTKAKQPIEFGSNGAVLNSENISKELADEYRKPSEHWLDLLLFKPTKWPTSALVMALGGMFLLGMRFAADDSTSLPFWLDVGPLFLIVAAGWWRVIWQKFFD